MKQKLLTLFALLVVAVTWAWADTETVSWKVGSTGPAVGTAFQVKNASEENVLQIAFGAMDSSKDDASATNYTTGEASLTISYNETNYAFDHYANTSNTNGNSKSTLAGDGSSTGNYMAFVPKYDGTLIIVVQNSGGKTTYLYEDGVAKSAVLIGTGAGTTAFDGEEDLKTLNDNTNYSGGIKLSVSANKVYTISVNGSKGRWMGAIYEYTNVVATQVATPTYSLGAWDAENSKYAVTLSCATAGATIHYSTDNKASYSDYTTALALAPGTTLDAYATKTGLDDSEAMAQYTVPAAPTLFNITFDKGDGDGIAPATVENIEDGTSITLPKNFTMYKDGYTLTGWNDGTTTYNPGASYSVTANKTLTAVYTANTVTLDDRTAAVAITFDFQKKNGAPSVQWQAPNLPTSGIWVAQASVAGKTIDVKMDWDVVTNGGKINNSAWDDWCQLNNGTTFTIPSAEGATVDIEAYNGDDATTTVNGVVRASVSSKTSHYEITSDAATAEIIMSGAASYYRTIKVTLPAPAAQPLTAVSDKTWDITNDAVWSSFSSATSATTIDNMEVYSGVSKTSSSTTIGGLSLSKALVLNNNPAADTRQLHIKVSPMTKISLYVNVGGSGRTLTVAKDSKDGDKLMAENISSKGVYTCEYTGENAADLFIYNGGSNSISVYIIKVEPMPTVTLNAKGYGTFSYASDAELVGATAYTAKLDVVNDKVTCSPATDNKVKAGEGVLLYGDANATVYIKSASGVATFGDVNDLKGTTKAGGDLVAKGENFYYVLSGDTFKKFTGDAFTAGKAYFESASDLASSKLTIIFDDETTNISNLSANGNLNSNATRYNLAGQKVTESYKGIVIVNGKKYMNK